MAIVNEPIQWKEPLRFRAGDTLKFQRSFNEFLPSDGWSITYTLTKIGGGGSTPAFQFTTVSDQTQQFHTVDLLNFGQGIANGDYILSGELVCAVGGAYPGERKSCYYDKLILNADLQDGLGDSNALLSFPEKMIKSVEERIALLGQQIVQSSNLQRNEIMFMQMEKLMNERDQWREEIQQTENLRGIANGDGSRNNLRPVFR